MRKSPSTLIARVCVHVEAEQWLWDRSQPPLATTMETMLRGQLAEQAAKARELKAAAALAAETAAAAAAEAALAADAEQQLVRALEALGTAGDADAITDVPANGSSIVVIALAAGDAKGVAAPPSPARQPGARAGFHEQLGHDADGVVRPEHIRAYLHKVESYRDVNGGSFPPPPLAHDNVPARARSMLAAARPTDWVRVESAPEPEQHKALCAMLAEYLPPGGARSQ